MNQSEGIITIVDPMHESIGEGISESTYEHNNLWGIGGYCGHCQKTKDLDGNGWCASCNYHYWENIIEIEEILRGKK